MGRTAGTPNKITKEVRVKLDNLINSLVNSIDVEELDMNQRIKMLQIALQYTLPRLQAMQDRRVTTANRIKNNFLFAVTVVTITGRTSTLRAITFLTRFTITRTHIFKY